MEKLVSVIVPVYGVEAYLKNCVDSILRQTYSNLEIILVDDGSPDNCGKLCDEYAEKDRRIRTIHKKNGGLSDARNTGIQIARGELITCVDSDDYLSDDFIAYLYTILEQNAADMSICGFLKTARMNEAVQTDDGFIKIYTGEEALEAMLYARDFTTSAWGKLYRAELFENTGYPVGRYSEDMFTTYKLILKSKKIVCGGRVCYYYLHRPDSILTGRFSQKHLDVFEALHMIRDTELDRHSVNVRSAYRSQLVSSVAELLEKHPPEDVLEKSGLWDEAKAYLPGVIFDNRCSKRVRAQAALMMLGRKFAADIICRYYKIKWKKQEKIAEETKERGVEK